jgi:hypothetical protein
MFAARASDSESDAWKYRRRRRQARSVRAAPCFASDVRRDGARGRHAMRLVRVAHTCWHAPVHGARDFFSFVGKKHTQAVRSMLA